MVHQLLGFSGHLLALLHFACVVLLSVAMGVPAWIIPSGWSKYRSGIGAFSACFSRDEEGDSPDTPCAYYPIDRHCTATLSITHWTSVQSVTLSPCPLFSAFRALLATGFALVVLVSALLCYDACTADRVGRLRTARRELASAAQCTSSTSVLVVVCLVTSFALFERWAADSAFQAYEVGYAPWLLLSALLLHTASLGLWTASAYSDRARTSPQALPIPSSPVSALTVSRSLSVTLSRADSVSFGPDIEVAQIETRRLLRGEAVLTQCERGSARQYSSHRFHPALCSQTRRCTLTSPSNPVLPPSRPTSLPPALPSTHFLSDPATANVDTSSG